MSDALPPELVQALAADPDARAAFDALPPSHKREYATWIAEAKRDETREARAAEAVERLRAGAETNPRRSGVGDDLA